MNQDMRSRLFAVAFVAAWLNSALVGQQMPTSLFEQSGELKVVAVPWKQGSSARFRIADGGVIEFFDGGQPVGSASSSSWVRPLTVELVSLDRGKTPNELPSAILVVSGVTWDSATGARLGVLEAIRVQDGGDGTISVTDAHSRVFPDREFCRVVRDHEWRGVRLLDSRTGEVCFLSLGNPALGFKDPEQLV